MLDLHMLQCVAVCCSVLQCVAECCSVSQSVAVCCSVLQSVAVCCRVLQCVAVVYSLPGVDRGWRRPIGRLKLQVFFRKRATNHRALLQKMTYKDKASCDSTPPCTTTFVVLLQILLVSLLNFPIRLACHESRSEFVEAYNSSRSQCFHG